VEKEKIGFGGKEKMPFETSGKKKKQTQKNQKNWDSGRGEGHYLENKSCDGPAPLKKKTARGTAEGG